MKLQKSTKRKYAILSVAVVLIVGVAIAWFLAQNLRTPDKKTTNLPEQTSKPAKKQPSSLQVSAMGDMLAHDSVVRQAKTADGYDFMPYFAQIQPLYSGSDVVFCNPETPSAGAKYGVSGYPTFNAPTEFARDLRKTGCNLINLATNHIADKGQGALDATLDEWQKLDLLAMAGANRNTDEQNQVRYFTKNGIKVAFVAFADFSNAASPNGFSINFYHDEALVRRLLGEARRNADVVIVSAHWGTEDSHGVNANQQKTAELFTELGADVIIGTGPHVLQKVTWLPRPDGQKTLVWYSIGNMLSSQLYVDQLTGGVAQFKLTKDNKGAVSITDVQFRPTFMSYQWSSPADRAAQNLLGRNSLKLQPLHRAVEETKLFNVTPEERLGKIRQWLGEGVKIIQ